MRLSAAGALFIAFAMVGAAIGIVASHALFPGFVRLSDQAQATTVGSTTTQLPLSRAAR